MHNTRPRVWRWLVVVAAGVALGVSGCSGQNRPYPVRGTILFEDGQPAQELAGYLVTFTSDELHQSAVGEVGADGTFRLTTIKDEDGAFPGQYRITLTPPPPPEMLADRRQPAPQRVVGIIDPRYEKPEQTDLVARVEPKHNEIPLTVPRLKKPSQ